MFKILHVRLQHYANQNFQMSKLALEKEEEPEIKLPAFAGSQRKQGKFPEKHLLRFINYAKAFDCVDHNKLWKALKEIEIPDHLTSLLRKLWVKKQRNTVWKN